MPQPPLDIVKYLSKPLPNLREQYPPGTGGTGPRAEWDGTLKSVQVIDGFNEQVQAFFKTLPSEPIPTHPAHKYPKFVQVSASLPQVIKSPADLQKALSTLPLPGISSVLTALDADEADLQLGPGGAQALDKAGYESDGGEELEVTKPEDGKTKAWYWRFNKSPMGSGEFLLMQQGSDDVKLVVRTINSSAFSPADWDEYVVTGPYRYNTKSKASWYWSRSWGAAKRLNCQYYVLTDWKRWVFGKFDEKREHGWVSPLITSETSEPYALQALLFWARSAIGDANGFKAEKKDVSGNEELFPDNPARRFSSKDGGTSSNRVKKANESDIEESDVEGA
ncbi:hypothetical protein DB88DRAFT_501487 [Papiliotrema laurentii]|uniref:Uncharacterized protein n=1 Tax=Papiliotrema laurentii TaxID=5418 RepID=A0AAD9CV14_PAPLA|nr:hypothetical protein DB88DRAFT_501487 [Papiliotrema laurentii]